MTAANPRTDWAFPRHRPLPVSPEDISKTTFFFCHLAHYSRAGGGMAEGGVHLLSSFVRQHSELHRQTLQRLTQSPPGALRRGPGWERGTIRAQNAAGEGGNKNLANGCGSYRRHRHRSRMLQIWETLTGFLWARIVPPHTWAPCQTSEGLRRSPWSARPFSLLCPSACWSCCGYF